MVAAGYAAGTFAHRGGKHAPWLSPVLTVVVMALVFTMGLRIGANGEVVSNLDRIGLYALAITVAVLAFTGAALHVVRKALGLDRYGMVRKHGKGDDRRSSLDGELLQAEAEAASRVEAETDGKAKGIDPATVRILLSVVAGLLCGLAVLHFQLVQFNALNAWASIAIRIGLCTLLLLIGVELGMEGTLMHDMREAGLRILCVPFTVVAATLAACALCSLFLPVSLKECLAIGAGFGWYTLAPGIIMDQGYLTAGAVSFLHNIMRELFAILAVPAVAQRVGYIECTGLGGATSMDVGLPVIEQSTNGITAVYAFVSGAVLSLAVPVLVPLLLAL